MPSMPAEALAGSGAPTPAAEVVALLDALSNRYDQAHEDPEFGPLISAAWSRYEALKRERRSFDECWRTARIEAVEALLKLRNVVLPP